MAHWKRVLFGLLLASAGSYLAFRAGIAYEEHSLRGSTDGQAGISIFAGGVAAAFVSWIAIFC